MESKLFKNLRILLILSNKAYGDLANHLGVSPKTVGSWVNNRSNPSIELLIKTAKYFKVTLDQLVLGDMELKE